MTRERYPYHTIPKGVWTVRVGLKVPQWAVDFVRDYVVECHRLGMPHSEEAIQAWIRITAQEVRP